MIKYVRYDNDKGIDMSKDKCQCIDKSYVDDIRSALITARDIYRHIITTLAIDIASPEYISLEERANKFNNSIYQLEKITCIEETAKRKDDKGEKVKQMTPGEIAKLPLKERIRIATAIAGTVSE